MTQYDSENQIPLQSFQSQPSHGTNIVSENKELFEYITDSSGRKFLVRSKEPQLQPASGQQRFLPGNIQQIFNIPGAGYATPARGEIVACERYETILGADGNQYKMRISPAQNMSHQGQQGHLPQHHQPLPQSQQQQQSSAFDQSSWQQQDRARGMTISLDETRATKRLKLSDCLKRCPVKWAKSTNLANMNMSAYGYASIAELEASMTSKTDPISQGELLAKVRHIKNVFEVCCLNSKDIDFKTYGWILARDYEAKVSNRVDQGFSSWEEMPLGVHTADLVSAQCDYPRPVVREKKEEVKEKEKDTRLKRLCTTYNTCSTEYKCDYEVSNPEKECFRIHECTWCRKHIKQGLRHQESRCRKKEAKGE